METKTNVSENAAAGEVAGEDTDLLTNSNLNNMSTTKKWTSTLLALGMAFFMVVTEGNAQEQMVKVADATEVVSASEVKVVKPVIAVPASLTKAMVTGKVEGDKAVVKESRVLLSPWVFNSSDPGEILLGIRYVKNGTPNVTCDDELATLPCTIMLPDDITPLNIQAYLNATYGTDSNALLLEASSWRNP